MLKKRTKVSLLSSTSEKINSLKTRFYFIALLTHLLVSFAVSFLLIFFLSFLSNLSWPLGLTAFLTCLVFCLFKGSYKRPHTSSVKNLALSLEMTYPKDKNFFLDLNKEQILSSSELKSLQKKLQKTLGEVSKFHKEKITKKLPLQVLLIVFFLFSAPQTVPLMENYFREGIGALKKLTLFKKMNFLQSSQELELSQKIKLTILEGAHSNLKGKKTFHLSLDSLKTIELISPNLVQLSLAPTQEQASLFLELHPSKKIISELVQKLRFEKKIKEFSVSEFELSFSVSQNSSLIIPKLSKNKKLADFKVDKLPIPLLSLKTKEDLTKPWSDHNPLKLEINVEAKNALAAVYLWIEVDKRSSKEVVRSVRDGEKLNTLSTTYELILEPYVNKDISQVTVYAEAIDQNQPKPLVGQSIPLNFEVISAYGRYQITLEKLNQLKEKLEESIEEPEKGLNKEAVKFAKNAVQDAENTPFFDSFDRYNIEKISIQTAKLINEYSVQEAMQLKENLADFLFEHELLDDRERDRDFFVGARALSRLLERAPIERSISVKQTAENMQDFLKKRRKRWAKRITYIQDKEKITHWQEIDEQQPFLRAFEEIKIYDINGPVAAMHNPSLSTLSQTVERYRKWLKQLEHFEEKEIERREKKIQNKLSSIRETLKELQKRQTRVSQQLDHSEKRSPSEMQRSWPLARLLQKTNSKESKTLEQSLKSLVPQASARLSFAIKAMQQTLENGERKNYKSAESNADLAGRLLQMARNQSKRPKRSGRSRRRKIASGDRYFGQSIHGGDLEIVREYKVDKRYRQQILQEAVDSDLDQSERPVLENYLRRIVR